MAKKHKPQFTVAAYEQGQKFLTQPIEVPKKIQYRDAKDLFDRFFQIWTIKRGWRFDPFSVYAPERVRYSYQWNNWNSWMAPERKAQYENRRLFEVWDAILKDAIRQPGLTGRERAVTNLDFYVMVPPEVQRVPAASPVEGRDYELRWSVFGEYHYFLHYAGPKAYIV